MNLLMDHLLTTVLGGDYTAEHLDFTPHYPADLDSLAVRRVFVVISDHGQIGHKHHFTDIDSYGDALCHPCGAVGWSPGWVKRGKFSGHNPSGTDVFIAGALDWRCAQVEHDRADVAHLTVRELLGAEVVEVVPVIAAYIDGSEPAKQRPGVPVPPMGYLVLTVAE